MGRQSERENKEEESLRIYDMEEPIKVENSEV